MPAFDKYGLILSPRQEIENHGADDARGGLANAMRYEWLIDIVAIVRNYDPELSIMGSVAPDFGILYHVAKIKDIIRAKSFTNYLEVSKAEFEESIDYNEIRSDNCDDFFHEVIIPWHGLGKFEVAPDVT